MEKENIKLNVTERIKTFGDAVKELGESNKLVAEYRSIGNNISPDLLAYLKLRIIAAALNEGWEPNFTTGEYRYYPWFDFYTKEEYDLFDDCFKERCVLRSDDSGEYCGVMAVSAGFGTSYTYSEGTRLTFKTEELARYAGTQFTDIWADFVLGKINEKEISRN